MIPIASPLLGDEEVEAATRVLRSGMLVQGTEVAAFEDDFSSLVGSRTCVAVSSGTSALHLALVASGIGPGDEVIVPSFTFAATANSVRLAGADPVFADIEPKSFNLDPQAVASAVTSRTAAIMPVHLFGHPANMKELAQIAARHKLLLIEDAAQAHGARLHDEPTGALGDAAAFSFYATKNMTTGEGGMVVVTGEDVARKVRLLRNQGMERQYRNEIVGYNMRMTDIAAAIGRVQLARLADLNGTRRKHASSYDHAFTELAPAVVAPCCAADVLHSYHQYTLRVQTELPTRGCSGTGRDALAESLENSGVDSKIFYPVPVHRLESFALDLDLPQTEKAALEVLSIPVGPHLSDSMVDTVIDAVLSAVPA